MDRQFASYVALLRGCASSPPRLGSALLALLAPHCEPRTERSALRQPATQSCHPRQEHCQLALAPLAKGQEVNSTWRLPCPHLPDRVLDKLPTAIGGLAPKVASIAIDCHVFMWRPLGCLAFFESRMPPPIGGACLQSRSTTAAMLQQSTDFLARAQLSPEIATISVQGSSLRRPMARPCRRCGDAAPPQFDPAQRLR
jgi:hypothetical protein